MINIDIPECIKIEECAVGGTGEINVLNTVERILYITDENKQKVECSGFDDKCISLINKTSGTVKVFYIC